MREEYNSPFPILIIFKIDDDGSALRVGANYKSSTDLESALKKFQEDNYVQLNVNVKNIFTSHIDKNIFDFFIFIHFHYMKMNHL
jgi:hypothetical protein